jgi:hypothetical protein
MATYVPLQRQAALYAQEATQLSVARQSRQVEYEHLAVQQANEITRLAGLRQQVEDQIALRQGDLQRVIQAEQLAEAERARTAAEHDRAVNEETVRQRELEAAITNTNNTIEAQKAAELAAVAAARQAQAQQLDEINAMKHQAFQMASQHQNAQAELQTKIQANEASLNQSYHDTTVREHTTAAIGTVGYATATAPGTPYMVPTAVPAYVGAGSVVARTLF